VLFWLGLPLFVSIVLTSTILDNYAYSQKASAPSYAVRGSDRMDERTAVLAEERSWTDERAKPEVAPAQQRGLPTHRGGISLDALQWMAASTAVHSRGLGKEAVSLHARLAATQAGAAVLNVSPKESTSLKVSLSELKWMSAGTAAHSIALQQETKVAAMTARLADIEAGSQCRAMILAPSTPATSMLAPISALTQGIESAALQVSLTRRPILAIEAPPAPNAMESSL
jgi:hypothetical protein